MGYLCLKAYFILWGGYISWTKNGGSTARHSYPTKKENYASISITPYIPRSEKPIFFQTIFKSQKLNLKCTKNKIKLQFIIQERYTIKCIQWYAYNKMQI